MICIGIRSETETVGQSYRLIDNGLKPRKNFIHISRNLLFIFTGVAQLHRCAAAQLPVNKFGDRAREKDVTQKIDETEGFQWPGHSNWTIYSPLSQFCCEHFPTFSLSYWGAYSYCPRPQRANNGKREFFQPQIRMRQRDSSAWNFQTGPFAACWATFVVEKFQLCHLHTGRPILITPEG